MLLLLLVFFGKREEEKTGNPTATKPTTPAKPTRGDSPEAEAEAERLIAALVERGLAKGIARRRVAIDPDLVRAALPFFDAMNAAGEIEKAGSALNKMTNPETAAERWGFEKTETGWQAPEPFEQQTREPQLVIGALRLSPCSATGGLASSEGAAACLARNGKAPNRPRRGN